MRRIAARHSTEGSNGDNTKVGPVPGSGFGALPALSVVAAIGLLICAIADTAARSGVAASDALIWLGLLTIFVPLALRLAMPAVSRPERIGCVVLLVMGMYLVKVAHSPVQFVFGDEFAHWRTAADISTTGRLFTENPLSIVSPQYPGLELITSAMSSVANISIHAAGVVILGVSRLLLALSLFLLLEALSGSSRLAGIASLLYAGNPNFVFWSAQFSYESLALPLGIFVIYVAAQRARAPVRLRRPFDVIMLIAGSALVVSHHLTAYAVIALLTVWALVALIAERRGRKFLMPPLVASFAIGVWVLIWMSVFAPTTARYLLPVVGKAVSDVLRFASGTVPTKEPFRGDPSLAAPTWERIVALGSVALIALLLLVSLVAYLRRARGWRRYRINSLTQALVLGALLFLPLQTLRALQSGTEISNRAGEFLFLPLGFVCAITLHYFWLSRGKSPWRVATFGAFATLVFMGGVILGLPPWARVPGPYLASGDTRAIQAQSLAANSWLRQAFGTGNGILADQTNAFIMGSYGQQDPQHGLSWTFFSPGFEVGELDALRRSGVDFVVVDRRVTSMMPIAGYYYEAGEPGAGRYTAPIDPAQLAKFDRVQGVARVFDSGDIVIYQITPRSATSTIDAVSGVAVHRRGS